MNKTLDQHVEDMMGACGGLEFICQSLENQDQTEVAFMIQKLTEILRDGVSRFEMVAESKPSPQLTMIKKAPE